MNKIEKLAAKDAAALMAADMAYGEGAGTRRKLVNAMIDGNLLKYADTDYNDLLRLHYEMLDQNKFATAAIKERKALDRAAKLGKSMRAIKSGNYQNLSTGVALAVGAGYILHKTGYDKVLLEESKKLYKKAKVEVKFRIKRAQGRNVEKL